jgi:flagellar P-ring protein precursor FlgI
VLLKQIKTFFYLLCVAYSCTVLTAQSLNGLEGTTPAQPTKKSGATKKRYIGYNGKSDAYFEKIRIKDLATFEGVRDNQLVGYGLVVGLNGSGDTLSNSPYTKESLVSMLERMGVSIRDGKIPSGKNVGAVMVTANLPPFARHGTKIDVSVSALGDAKDLRGGVLLVTPLYGADGEVYAVSQGTVSVSGLVAAGEKATITKGVPTAGMIVNGGIIEKEIGFDFETLEQINMSLRNPDFTTAERMAFKINTYFNQSIAHPTDPSTIQLKIPSHFKKDMVGFLTEVEQLRIRPDQTAKVVIDDTNGIIVVGKEVRISPVAISQGSITITVSEEPILQDHKEAPPVININYKSNNNNAENLDPSLTYSAGMQKSLSQIQNSRMKTMKEKFDRKRKYVNENSALETETRINMIEEINLEENKVMEKLQQENIAYIMSLQKKELEKKLTNPDGPNSNNQTETEVSIGEEKGKFTILNGGIDLEDIVNGLNSLGVTPKEMGSILRAIKAAGALQADIKET